MASRTVPPSAPAYTPPDLNVTHLDRFQDILGRVSYKDWRFRVVHVQPHHYYLQVEFDAADNDTSDASVQRGRKWLLSTHMTESEIVQTALKAVLAAEEHEAREQFKVEGVAVFGPHFDVFALVFLEQSGLLPQSKRAPMPNRS